MSRARQTDPREEMLTVAAGHIRLQRRAIEMGLKALLRIRRWDLERFPEQEYWQEGGEGYYAIREAEQVLKPAWPPPAVAGASKLQAEVNQINQRNQNEQASQSVQVR